MIKTVFYFRNRQVKFFTLYYIIVAVLILWSYFEGVGDISGVIVYKQGNKLVGSNFKAGYFSSFNYGLYNIAFLPLFFRSMFATYFTAQKLSDLAGDIEGDVKVNQAINTYSSYIIDFLKHKMSTYIFSFLLLFFCFQNLIVEKEDYKNISLGWVQGKTLKEITRGYGDTLTINKKFYFRNSFGDGYAISPYDSVRVTKLSFALKRNPPIIEFIAFISFAKLFLSIFTAIVFFFNINIIYGLIKFFKETEKKYLFQSSTFVKTMDDLVQHISLSGFFVTVFLFLRYITNAQKGSFKPFNWGNPLASDQYIFMLGMFFIPFTAITLFTYVYISDQAIDLKKWSWKNLVAFYCPNLFFLLTFFIYLVNFDPRLDSQLQFMRGVIHFINRTFLG